MIFEEFVMGCARSMGACISMRDESSDTKIPQKFEPGDYDKKELEKSKLRLKELEKMSFLAADNLAKEEYKKAVVYNEKQIRTNNELAKKYKSILEQVKAWQPPSLGHNEFKNFMISQL